MFFLYSEIKLIKAIFTNVEKLNEEFKVLQKTFTTIPVKL